MNLLGKLLVFLSISMHVFTVLGQKAATPVSENDTVIVVSKELARRLAEEYADTKELKQDLVPNYAREWMVTDRPHVAETPILTGKGMVQWETGFQLDKTKSSLQRTNDYTYNTTLIRLGLTRRFEARFEMAYQGTKIYKTSSDSVVKNTSGFSGLNVGSKVFLFDNKGIRPKMTLLYGLSLPFIGSKEYRPANTGGEIKFLFLNTITHFYDFEYNLGIEWRGDTKQAAYAYAFNNEIMITEKLHFFAEIYGYFYENNNSEDRFDGTFTNDHRINSGIWYLFNKDLQLDFSGGVGLSKASPDYYVSIGFSNRFSVSKKH